MAALANAQYNVITGGEAKFLRHFTVNADENGYTIDLSEVVFEGQTGKAKLLKICNTGSNLVYIAFDSSHVAISIGDNSTWNVKLSNYLPFSEITIEGEASQVSFKSEPGLLSSIEMIVW